MLFAVAGAVTVAAACFKILFVCIIGILHIDAAAVSQVKAITIIVLSVVMTVAVAIRIVNGPDAATAAAPSFASFAIVSSRTVVYFESHVIAINI